MTGKLNNPFLATAMARIRSARSLLPADALFFNRVERVKTGNYLEVWFLTGGCTWDHEGGCTMCNYGRGPSLPPERMVEAVRTALASVKVEVSELLVSPSGSMFDPREVPPEARRGIYALMRDFPARLYLVETRAESVSEEVVRDLTESLPSASLAVEIGLESSCPWIQRFCVNKGSHPDAFVAAAGLLAAFGVRVYANVSLGTAFLTPAEAVEDAVLTLRWAYAHGADTGVLFPLHVKPFTLLAKMAEQGRYRSPSLWSLVEVLARLEPAELARTEISWYRSYYDDDTKTTLSPDTCPRCRETVLRLLDAYRATQAPEVVAEFTRLRCDCRSRWEAEMAAPSGEDLPARVLSEYGRLAGELGLEGWWRLHAAETATALFATAPRLRA